jgi:ParB family chromosome partitioning protein
MRPAASEPIRLPAATDPVKATQSTPTSVTIASPTCGEQVHDAGRLVLQRAREQQRRERRQLRGLAHDGVAGRERGRDLPRPQEQREVPWRDAADDAHRLLQHERELSVVGRRHDAAGARAPELRVEVERASGLGDLVAVLDERLAALGRHHGRQLLRARSQARGDRVERVGAERGRGARPAGRGSARSANRLGHLHGARGAQHTERSREERVLDEQLLALAVHELAADQQPGARRRGSRIRPRQRLFGLTVCSIVGHIVSIGLLRGRSQPP